MTQVILTTTGLNNWTVPTDWNSNLNTVECVGSGGNGSVTGYGGAGGGYAIARNVALTAGNSVAYTIGAGGGATGVSGATFFNGTEGSGHNSCEALGGTNAGFGGAGAGGTVVNGTGSTGGAGGSISTDAGGGGGAAGPHGAGNSGANGTAGSGGAGGSGDNGSGGSGGAGTTTGAAGNGGNGSEWTTAGSGGGGGGAAIGTAGNGGNYGGGGGGALGGGTSGSGIQGVIVITYTPQQATPYFAPPYIPPENWMGSPSGLTQGLRSLFTNALQAPFFAPRPPDPQQFIWQGNRRVGSSGLRSKIIHSRSTTDQVLALGSPRPQAIG